MPLAALNYLSTSFLVVISPKMLIHALLHALSYSYLKTEKKKKVNLIQIPDVAHSI